jgi:hypothetical protein
MDRDRSQPLDTGTTITNRLLALMGSTSFPKLKRCAGELLFACFDRSLADFGAYIGLSRFADYSDMVMRLGSCLKEESECLAREIRRKREVKEGLTQ